MSRDLLLNLLSEFIGILFTVLIVDQLARRREKKRWALAEQMCFAELCDLIGDFLNKFIPEEEKRKTFAQYKYGSYFGNPCIDADTKLLKFLEKRHAVFVNVMAIISLRNLYTNLQKLRRDNSHLLDPEIVSCMLQIENGIEWITEKDYHENDIHHKEGSVIFPTRELIPAVKIMHWLGKKADKKITLSEYKIMDEERKKHNSEILRKHEKE